jgi:serine protease Do
MGRAPSSLIKRFGLLGLTASFIPLTYLTTRATNPHPQPQAITAASTSTLSAPGDFSPPRADRAVQASDTLDLTGLQARFEAIAKSVSPSVVAISASVADTNSDDALRSDEMNGQKLEHILDKVVRTVGTGFVIDAAGYILTNEHVVGGAECLWVTTDAGKVYPAVVIGSDPRADLAVLKIPAANLAPVKFAPYDSVRRGQWTIALGNPYGLAASGEMSMSVGVVSATDRSLPKLASKENRLYSNLIQTTAEINPGNSGGPLFDLAGQIIGVNTAVILPQKQTNGIGFAMPVTPRLMDVVRQLKDGNEIPYARLGVTVVTPTDKERRAANVRDDSGARVESVEDDSPATAADLRPADIITHVNGAPIRDGDHFIRLIGECPTSAPTNLTLARNGKPLTLAAHLVRKQPPAVAVTRDSQRLRWRGMLLGPTPSHWTTPSLSPLATGNSQLATKPEGLLVLAVEKNSPAEKMGITQGSVIKSVAGQPVASIPSLQRILNDTPSELCKFELASPLNTLASTTPNEH